MDRTGRDQRDPAMNRREFVIWLSLATGAGIAGYVLSPVEGAPPPLPRRGAGRDARPRLAPDVRFGRDGTFLTLTRPEASPPFLCGVNATGEEIVRLLDGQRTVTELSHAVAGKLQIAWSEAFEAKIALFVAHVSALDLLVAPFSAYIVEVQA